MDTYLTEIVPMSEVIEQELCKGGHTVDGKTPMLTDIHLDGRTCDCGRIKFYKTLCGCPEGEKHYELKSEPNE